MNGAFTLRHDLEERLRVLLPATYELFDDDVQPRSMGSAGLRFGDDGRVLWDEMWGSFCDLAMAGGPPHRGTLLQPGSATAPELEDKSASVSAEICRGIGLVTGLCAEPAPFTGFVRLSCTSAAMAGWLARAIVMENVTAVVRGLSVYLPTGPAFRLEKEIKNVITSVAKTCHYWQDHMPESQHHAIAALLARMERESPYLQPALQASVQTADLRVKPQHLAEAMEAATRLQVRSNGAAGWLGLDCHGTASAIWMMRALAVNNLATRREDSVVYFAVDPAQGDRLLRVAHETCALAVAQGVLRRPEAAPESATAPNRISRQEA